VGPRVAALKLNRGDDAPHMWRPEGVTVKYWNRYLFVLYYIHYLGYTKEEALVMWINKLNYSLRFGSTRVKHNTIAPVWQHDAPGSSRHPLSSSQPPPNTQCDF
jgi:hypothetical protein